MPRPFVLDSQLKGGGKRQCQKRAPQQEQMLGKAIKENK
jgi:hypothetical protein